jgi:Na+/melibiose symporter-like transporter
MPDMPRRFPASGADGARLPSWRLAAFASIVIPIAGAGLPLAVYLPAYYAQSLGLATVGAVFLLTRLWDTLADPLIGVLSDRTRTPFGRRKPWIAAGGVLFGVAAWAIFFPPAGIGPVYLAAWLFAFYLGWSMILTPLSAWSGELSAQYHERSRIQTFVQTTTALGLLAVLILPTLLDQGRHAGPGASVRAMGYFTLATLVPTLILGLFSVRDPARPAVETKRLSFGAALKALLGDPLLLRVLASDFAVTLGQTIRGSLFVFFVVAYMGLPKWASGLFLLQFVFGVFASPIWLKISYRLGKSRTAVLGELVQVAINLGLLFAAPGAFPLVLGLTIAQGLAQGSGNLMLRAIVADVVDKQALETGENRSGLLFSTFSLSGKLATAVAVGVALPLVALLGFRPVGHNTPEALLGLKLVFALGPALSHLVSAGLILRFPLDQSRHAEIQSALAARGLNDLDRATLNPSGLNPLAVAAE